MYFTGYVDEEDIKMIATKHKGGPLIPRSRKSVSAAVRDAEENRPAGSSNTIGQKQTAGQEPGESHQDCRAIRWAGRC